MSGLDAGVRDAGLGDAGVVIVDGGLPVDGGLIIFITRAAYWPNFTQHAPGADGLAAADVLCDAVAQSALLPGSYRAWVSSPTTSALSRMAAGPWVERFRDGGSSYVFTSKIGAGPGSLAGQPLVPITVHEFRLPTTATSYWTGTAPGGVAAADTCNGFTVSATTSTLGVVGQVGATTNAWTDNGTVVSCNTPRPLLCMQHALAPAPVIGTGMKRVFVTSTTYTGDLKTAGARATGLAGADALCNARALARGLGGTWIAWLSSNTINAWDRVADVGPWYQAQNSGTPMLLTLTNRAMLRSLPANVFAIDETGSPQAGDIWTGTTIGGMRTAETCNGFESSSNAVSGTYGTVGAPTQAWTVTGTSSCSIPKRLLCLEQ